MLYIPFRFAGLLTTFTALATKLKVLPDQKVYITTYNYFKTSRILFLLSALVNQFSYVFFVHIFLLPRQGDQMEPYFGHTLYQVALPIFLTFPCLSFILGQFNRRIIIVRHSLALGTLVLISIYSYSNQSIAISSGDYWYPISLCNWLIVLTICLAMSAKR